MKKIIVVLSLMIGHLGFSQLELPNGANLYHGKTLHIDAFNEDYYIAGNSSTYNLEIGVGNTVGSRRAIVINSSRNVGIGVGNPKADLHVGGSYISYMPASDVLAVFEGAFFSTVNITGTAGSQIQFGNQTVANKVELAYEQWSTGLKVKVDGSQKVVLGGSQYGLDVSGAGRFTGNLFADGNVGIGTTTPEYKFHVTSGVKIRKSTFGVTNGSNENSWVRDDWLTGNNGPAKWNQAIAKWERPSGTYNDIGGILYQDEGTYFLREKRGTKLEYTNSEFLNTAYMFADINNGNIGIGTVTPDEKLSVNGNIHTKEVRVDLIGWSDFVFKDDYCLPTLQEVESHIKDKGHLKDIPSAKEVAENGILLGEMDSRLLQKIEELVLYTIEQEKRILSIEESNEELKRENRILKSLLERVKKLEEKTKS